MFTFVCYSVFYEVQNTKFNPKAVQLFEYIFKNNIYKKGTVSVRKCGCLQCCC